MVHWLIVSHFQKNPRRSGLTRSEVGGCIKQESFWDNIQVFEERFLNWGIIQHVRRLEMVFIELTTSNFNLASFRTAFTQWALLRWNPVCLVTKQPSARLIFLRSRLALVLAALEIEATD
jgi:hypothetical protein